MNDVIERINENINSLVKIICSNPLKSEYKKVILRRIEGDRFLSESYTKTQVFHKPIQLQEIEKWLKTHVFECFKQSEIVFTTHTLTILTNKKGTVSVKRRQAETLMQAVHNRKKKYIINEGEDIPVMKDLGVFTSENKVASKMHDKFRQINRFIETVDDVFKDENKDITILDFGCGKSYLTFLLYYYFSVKKSCKTRIIGYDLKKEVVDKCNETAKKYGYDGLEFIHADVKKDKLYGEKIDMIVTLHACDTATDYAIKYAIDKNVKYIFSVPCCQHEINAQIECGGEFDIFLSHGLIKERFSALLTDAVRVEVLENAGYRVDCLEFVGFDASPKNLMIRAQKTTKVARKSFETEKLLKKYNVSQTLILLTNGSQNDKEEDT